MTEKTDTVKKFGTFPGVFVPSVLAILGAVMYLIVPKVIAGVGLLGMVIIIILAHTITLATASSVSSIATNIQVKGGGLYYLISRSLGTAFGGSMGIQLFLAQTMASAFYTVAFTKAFHDILGLFGIIVSERMIAMICMALLFIIVFRGAGFVIRIQYVILTIIGLSVISIFIAPATQPIASNFFSNPNYTIPFWVAFALFFPAVTGIDAGIGMSGDLKNPKKSLVIGTFLAISITLILYLAIIIKLSVLASPFDLASDRMIMKNVSAIPFFIYAGILVATLSSALSCMMTGPRSLRAMVTDKIFSEKLSFIGKSIGKSKEPHYALIISFIIAETVIYMGDLELLSVIVSMFFLNVYGWVNGASLIESISMNPSFRPSFKSPWFISLYGMIACYIVMYLYNPLVMIIGIIFQLLVLFILLKKHRSIKIESVWDGLLFKIFTKVLKKIQKSQKSKKNWRPTLISFSINEKHRDLMLSIANSITSSRSITKLYCLQKGNIGKRIRGRAKIDKEIKHEVKENKYDIFTRAIITNNYNSTIKTIAQSETIGNLPLNTIMIDYDERMNLEQLANLSLKLKKNFLLIRNKEGFETLNYIDVWWSNSANGNLGLILSYLMTHSSEWIQNDPIIRVFNIVNCRKETAAAKERLKHMVEQSRIENIFYQVICKKEHLHQKTIAKMSKGTDLVIIGLPKNDKNRVEKKSIQKVKDISEKLKSTMIVCAYEQIDFRVY